MCLRRAKQQLRPPLRHYPIQQVLVQMQMHVRDAPRRCTNNTPPLRAAGTVLVPAPAVALHFMHRDARHAVQAACISDLFNHKPMLDKMGAALLPVTESTVYPAYNRLAGNPKLAITIQKPHAGLTEFSFCLGNVIGVKSSSLITVVI